MRDNLILMRGEYDPNEICDDMVGGLFEGFDSIEIRGVLAWSDPWHISGVRLLTLYFSHDSSP
jgi:hypothetical protein